MIEKKKIKKITLFSICVLSFLTFLSAPTLAKFISVINKTSNSSIAKWNVSIPGEDNKVLPTITIGDSSTYQDYNLNITSLSEVGINYSVTIDNVPDGLEIQVDNNTIYEENNNKIIINNLGTFDANDNNLTHTHTLTIIAPININIIDNKTLDIDVTFTQKKL